MGTIITKPGGTQVGYKGFKYNVTYYYGYFPPAVPSTGQIVVIFYDNGEGGYDFGGISISHTNADGVYIGDVVQKIANQNVTIINASGNYNVISGTFTNFASYSRIDSVTAWGNVDPSGIGGSTNVVYADFGTSNTGTVSSVSALTLTSSGTNLTSTVTNSTTTPVITLNVPNASATNRGALTTTDWSAFNAKQEALVSGTNIKTINGNSVLGSGDLTISSGPIVYTANNGFVLGNTGGSYAIVNTITIPAGVVPATWGVLEATGRFTNVTGSGTLYPAISISNSSGSQGSILALGLDTTGSQTMIRTFNVQSRTTMFGSFFGSAAASDYQNSGVTASSLNINFNSIMYLHFLLIIPAGATATCRSAKVTIY